MLTTQQKEKIFNVAIDQRGNFQGSDQKFATSLGINPSVYSRLKKGDFTKTLSESEWLRVGRVLGVALTAADEWKVAKTTTYKYIYNQLSYCQENSIARVFCDRADIGKSTTAKDYAARNKNVAYVDCSLCKTHHAFIRTLARKFGIDDKGKLRDVQDDMIYYVRSLEQPLIILDEAGDLSYPAWLEIKALWNALEGACGWYMLGADGLAAKIDRHRRSKKVGYAEIFRRFGSDYMQATPTSTNEADYAMYISTEAEKIIALNLPGVKVTPQELLKKSGSRQVMSLTLLKDRIIKYKKSA